MSRRYPKRPASSSSSSSVSHTRQAVRKASHGASVPEDARVYRVLAAAWLRYDRGCYLTTFERSPWDVKELPDVLGMDRSRRLIEVEIKVSKADFLKDADKPHRRNLLLRIVGRMTTAPQELWYLVPRHLVSVVCDGAPEYAGVLCPSLTQFDPRSGLPLLEICRPALRLHSMKLPIPQVFTMAKDMSASLVSVLRDYAALAGTVSSTVLCVDQTESDPMLDYSHRSPRDVSAGAMSPVIISDAELAAFRINQQ